MKKKLTVSVIVFMHAFLMLTVSFLVTAPHARASWTNGPDASVVLGQVDFTSNGSGTTADTMKSPVDIAVDPLSSKVFIADYSNNRVLRFTSVAAAISGSSAEAVFGQADFTSGQPNRGLPAASENTLYAPVGVFVDAGGRLWVSDRQNSRILRFDNASTKASGADADGVLGQSDFTGKSANRGAAGPAANTLNFPGDIYVDASGKVWIADESNSRVLRFDNAASKPDGADADGVLGQGDFTTLVGGLTQNRMDWPRGIYGDSSGNIFVADYKNRRVLRFDNASSKLNGANADGVLGQADFTSNASATTATGVLSAEFVAMDNNGRLYLADRSNHRILIYNNASTKPNGAAADNVLGQANFTSGLANRGGPVAANTLNGPMGCFFENRALVADFSNNRVLGFEFSPTVTTQPVSGIGPSKATGHGTITNLGASNPTAHGMVWNTAGNPTLADNSTDEGAAGATGAFTSNMTGLSYIATYYVRAYATNTLGTSYGNQVSFTTSLQIPELDFEGVGGGGCFIATAAYGSPIEQHVKILRDFRDQFLLTNKVGDTFVRIYYTYSPPIAEFIAKREILRTTVRWGLLPLVGVSWVTLNLGPVPGLILIAIFGFFLISLAGFRRGFKMR
jgi:sugar lactone lactonase YvrE